MGVGDGVGGVAPEAEAEAAFVGVVDVAVVDEGVDGGEGLDFFPGVGVGGGLELLALGGEEGVEALLAEDDAAGFAGEEEFGFFEVLGEDLEILKRDFVGVVVGGDGFVCPGAGVAEVFGVGVPGDVPVEVAALSDEAGEGVEEVAAGGGFLGADVVHGGGPVVVEGGVGAGVLGVPADGGVGDAVGFFVFAGGGFEGDEAHVVPEEVGVDFVADDPAPDAAVLRVGAAPAFGEGVDGFGVEGAGGVGGADAEFVVFAVAGVEGDGVAGGVLGGVGEEDEVDEDVLI